MTQPLLRATLAGGLLAALCGVAQAQPSAEAEQSWTDRSTAPGVVYANNFDDRAAAEDGILQDGAADHVSWDQTTRASGAGSLRFEIRPGDFPNSGNWRTNFSDDLSVKFGENTIFYVQFRYRRSLNMDGIVFPLRTGNGGRKLIIIGEGDYPGMQESGSCTALELVTQDNNQRGIFQSYHNCGQFAPYEVPFDSECDRRDFRLQTAIDHGPQGVGGCEGDRRRYSLRSQNRGATGKPPNDDDGSLRLAVGEWQTVLIEVAPGPLGSAFDEYLGGTFSGFTQSSYQAWVANEGEDYVKFESVSPVVFRRSSGDDPASGEDYGKVWLLPFHTGQDSAGAWPINESAFIWYDELIVSTQPIVAPTGGVPGGTGGGPGSGGGGNDGGNGGGGDDDGDDDDGGGSDGLGVGALALLLLGVAGLAARRRRSV